MKKGQRFTTGLFGSIVFHILTLLFLGIAIYLYDASVPKAGDKIVEVSLVSSGGAPAVGQASARQYASGKKIETVIPHCPEDIVEHKENIQEQINPVIKEQENQQKGNSSNNDTGPAIANASGSNSGSEGRGQDSLGSENNIGAGEPVQPPRLVYREQPDYPSKARQDNIEGTTYVRLLVSAKGDVESVSVANSSGSGGLDSAAVAAAYQWRFTPAKDERGNSVRCYVSLPIAFRLR